VESDQPVGAVTDYLPKKANPGATITVKVSKGPQVDMPNLDGLKKQAAIDLLRSKGWDGQMAVTEVQMSLDQSDKDDVVAQDIPPGARIARNQTIKVQIASRPPPGADDPEGMSRFCMLLPRGLGLAIPGQAVIWNADSSGWSAFLPPSSRCGQRLRPHSRPHHYPRSRQRGGVR